MTRPWCNRPRRLRLLLTHMSVEPQAQSGTRFAPSSQFSDLANGSDGLLRDLVADMRRRWRTGERPGADEILARNPDVVGQPENAVRLIYEEICLRQEAGEAGSSLEFLRRFPQWRSQLELVLDCHHLVEDTAPAPILPEVGDTLDEFHLVAELGRGGQGVVFLATQPFLADRPVVLKLTSCDGSEHLSLARLQHTHIVPLFSVRDYSCRRLRALCMPYFGGVTLAAVIDELARIPSAQRAGKDIVAVMDRAQNVAPITLPCEGPARRFLAEASYTRAACGIAICLAEALHYAHDRGLAHLDVKPANVLLTADGQPMLLDFHLAQAPFGGASPAPDWMGGTPAYASPEQHAALANVRDGREIEIEVNGCSDIYSLGLLLYEVLGGKLPKADKPPAPLHELNPQVSIGLSDVICKCLNHHPKDRYQDAASLAADLRRHLEHQPLHGVANRSPAECLHKWRFRFRHSLTWTRRLIVVAAAALIVGSVTAYAVRLREEAKSLLAESDQRLRNCDYAGTIQTLARGMSLSQYLPGSGDLRAALEGKTRVAERLRAAQELHQLSDKLRFLFGDQSAKPDDLRKLEQQCREIWLARSLLLNDSSPDYAEFPEAQIRADFLDLAILWSDLRSRSADPLDLMTVQSEVLQVLAEAEAFCGPSFMLSQERRRYGAQGGDMKRSGIVDEFAPKSSAESAWDYYVRGRLFLRDKKWLLAVNAFERATELKPREFWPHFYSGVCAYHLRQYDVAVHSFGVCIALAPEKSESYYNRAQAYAALGLTERAGRDYDRAASLIPGSVRELRQKGERHPPE